MIFRQLFDPVTCTFTYLLADVQEREAVLIDPVLERVEDDLALLDELGLGLEYVLDTHVHADHVTAAATLRKICGCNTAISARAGVDCADLLLRDGAVIHTGALSIHVLETPGHTPACLSYRCENMVFTGDALLIGGCGRTDLQGGDAARLYDSITRKLFTLPDDTLVFPGHDYRGRRSSSIGAEKRNNPRLRLGRDAFLACMDRLDLPMPRRIHTAVPANRACGEVHGP
jgi:Zn-dependent hydrolases, including glyoxylases